MRLRRATCRSSAIFKPSLDASHVDQCGSQTGERVAQQCIECGTKERIESALQMNQPGGGIRQPVQEGRAGVGRRLRTARVGPQVCDGRRSLVFRISRNYGREAGFCQWEESGPALGPKVSRAAPQSHSASYLGYYLATQFKVSKMRSPVQLRLSSLRQRIAGETVARAHIVDLLVAALSRRSKIFSPGWGDEDCTHRPQRTSIPERRSRPDCHYLEHTHTTK